MTALYLFAALGLGAIISMQPAINAQMALRLGSPLFAAICSIVISLAMIVVVWTTLGLVTGTLLTLTSRNRHTALQRNAAFTDS